MKLRKLWPLAGALFATVCASAFAQSSYGSSDTTSSSSNMQSGQQGTYQRGTFREITPPAGPRVAHGADVFITANFIWWKAVQDGLSYAMKVGNAADTLTEAATLGRDWDPGFKVGLGLSLSHDGWDLFAQYTWLRPDDRTSMSSPFGISPRFTLNDSPFAELPTNATAKWNLQFNVIDLELGRNFYLSQFLTMRPFIGFKGTWQEQDTTIRFFSDPEVSLAAYKKMTEVETWGVGVRAGLNLSFYMSKCWSIFGNAAWTNMWVNYHERLQKDIATTALGVSTPSVNLNASNFYTVKQVVELELGLRWQTWFSDDNYHFLIQAGWEEQIWLAWGSLPTLAQPRDYDLTFHGLNLKFRFDF